MSNSLWPHRLQHASFPVHHHSRSLLKLMWIQSVMPSNHLILCRPLLLLPSILPSIKVFPNDQFFASGIGISASASVLPMNIQGWFPLGWTGLISLQIRWFYVTSLPIFWLPLSSLSGSPLYGAGQFCFVLLIPIQCSIWHLCFLTRDQTHRVWTTREVPDFFFFFK